LAPADYQEMFGHPLVEACPVDPETGELAPVVTIVTDNGGPFRSFRFESFITAHPSAAPRAHPGEDARSERLS
jgi:putative transposase